MGKGKGYFTDYPKCVFAILGNVFCERFSFYGLKAILVIYLNRALLFDENSSTSIYHGFNFACYFMPLFGAMLADGWLGKYKTILFISIVYVVGSATMAVGAVPFLGKGEYIRWLPFVGLFFIAIGIGGIKPCTPAFGGDQFEDHQVRQKDTFFSVFYMAINLGSLLSMIITPILRSQVFCFGDNCYALAFGIPAILMFFAFFFFLAGTKWYNIIPPKDNVIGKLFGCVGTAIVGKCKSRKGVQKDHWLEYAEDSYGKNFVTEVKAVMGVLFMFLPLPIFWTLFDQQGSRWTLQAGQMDGDFGSFVMQPDMVQVLNPLLIVLMVPFLESVVFPCVEKLKLPNSPLQRLGLGMFLAATSFIIAAILQITINASQPAAVENGMSRFKFINTAPCSNVTAVVQHFGPEENFVARLDIDKATDAYNKGDGSRSIQVHFAGCQGGVTDNNTLTNVTFNSNTEYNVIFSNPTDGAPVVQEFEQDLKERTLRGRSSIRFINTLPQTVDIRLNGTGQDPHDIKNLTSFMQSDADTFNHMKFQMFVMKMEGNETMQPLHLGEVESKNGAVFTVVLRKDARGQIGFVQFTDITPNTVNIFLLVPQYFVMSLGETFFSVTGLSFAYSQAPPSMKSVLQAAWLLTLAFGNLIVIIVAEAGRIKSQVAEYFLFAGLTYLTVIIFALMGWRYKYVESHDNQADDVTIEEENKDGVENKAFESDVYTLPGKTNSVSSEPPQYKDIQNDNMEVTEL